MDILTAWEMHNERCYVPVRHIQEQLGISNLLAKLQLLFEKHKTSVCNGLELQNILLQFCNAAPVLAPVLAPPTPHEPDPIELVDWIEGARDAWSPIRESAQARCIRGLGAANWERQWWKDKPHIFHPTEYRVFTSGSCCIEECLTHERTFNECALCKSRIVKTIILGDDYAYEARCAFVVAGETIQQEFVSLKLQTIVTCYNQNTDMPLTDEDIEDEPFFIFFPRRINNTTQDHPFAIAVLCVGLEIAHRRCFTEIISMRRGYHDQALSKKPLAELNSLLGYDDLPNVHIDEPDYFETAKECILKKTGCLDVWKEAYELMASCAPLKKNEGIYKSWRKYICADAAEFTLSELLNANDLPTSHVAVLMASRVAREEYDGSEYVDVPALLRSVHDTITKAYVVGIVHVQCMT